jgi:hypothetical protein
MPIPKRNRPSRAIEKRASVIVTAPIAVFRPTWLVLRYAIQIQPTFTRTTASNDASSNAEMATDGARDVACSSSMAFRCKWTVRNMDNRPNPKISAPADVIRKLRVRVAATDTARAAWANATINADAVCITGTEIISLSRYSRSPPTTAAGVLSDKFLASGAIGNLLTMQPPSSVRSSFFHAPAPIP